MKLGILLEVEEGLDWEQWRRVCADAERLDFESLWLSDHLQSPWFAGRRGLETWTALAVAAAETKRLVLGPLVSPITFREPAIVARMAESLNTLSGGRLVVGLGLGWNTNEHRSGGMSFPALSERLRRLEQTMERVRDNCPNVRILVGGKGSSTLRVAAKLADEWNVTTSSPEEFHKLAAQLDRLCLEHGRDPRSLHRSAAMGILIGRDQLELDERLHRMRRCVPPLTDLESARAMGWLVGTPDDIRQQVTRLEQVGVERVILGHYDVADSDTLDVIKDTLA